MKIMAVLIVVIIVLVVGINAFISYQMNQIPKMTFNDMLNYTTKDKEKAVITVGIIRNDETSYTVYGENGTELPQNEHIYEIGSLTKTFNTALLYKALTEGKIKLDDSIDMYLDLPQKNYYPTIKRLITHTSGYKSHYFETPMITNFFQGRNSFYGISDTQLLDRIGKIDLNDQDYEFKYSNFGISVLGAVLSEVYGQDYNMLINEYIINDLSLENTRISDGLGDLGDYWDWNENDAYMPAGALTSTIEDMLKYAILQLNETPEYLSGTHAVLAEINATTASYAKMNIRMDSVGAAWMLDNEHNIIWHNGGTSDYNCYLGFDLDKQIAVVILSNLSPNDRIPATVMGARLLIDLQLEKE